MDQGAGTVLPSVRSASSRQQEQRKAKHTQKLASMGEPERINEDMDS